MSDSRKSGVPAVPALPEGYVVPKVWSQPTMDGVMSGMNAPTAGARSQKELPVGEHALQLYSLGTPNGVKVTMLLEELQDLKQDVEYDAWTINIMQLDQFTSGFVAINPNSKIPALVDREFDPPLRVFESGNILKYLAEKYDAFIPKDIRGKTECFNWLFWQMGAAPYLGGGFGHFYKYAPVKIEYAIDRFTLETKRQLDVLDKQLAGKQFICGDEYTIADIATFPWIRCLDVGYAGKEFLEMDSYKNVTAWLQRIGDRPATKRGIRVNGFAADKVAERHSKKDFD